MSWASSIGWSGCAAPEIDGILTELVELPTKAWHQLLDAGALASIHAPSFPGYFVTPNATTDVNVRSRAVILDPTFVTRTPPPRPGRSRRGRCRVPGPRARRRRS